MAAEIIDGKALAKAVQDSLCAQVEEIRPKLKRSPQLAVVLVGDNPASKVYVKSKSKKAKKCGIDVLDIALPAGVSNEELQGRLRQLSERSDLDGILLQLPLPSGLDEFSALMCIDPALDVDGLHPVNQGLLLRGEQAPQPCTPKGCMMLIEQGRKQLGLSTDLKGLNAVVVGRSILVGKPLALMLLSQHCTVTMCHSRTADLKAECARADILVAAVGKTELITKEFVKPGAVIVDVGINRTEEGKLLGDVDFASVSEVAGAVTPVPGGVGPMTIAMLLANTVEAAGNKIN